MKNKKIIIGVVIIAIITAGALFFRDSQIHHPPSTIHDPEYYTCGMHPDVRVSPEEYNKGNVNCPICNMKLTPVYKESAAAEEKYYGCGVDAEGKCPNCDLKGEGAECVCGEHSFTIKGKKLNCPVCKAPMRELTEEEVGRLKGVIGRVKIKGEQARLAGVAREVVRKQHLYKEIRTVGQVAYDPDLAIAEEEYISSLKALEKIEEGRIPEIAERAKNLARASKRKLKLLGLSETQIKEIEESKEIHTSLILPEEKMWIYGEVYEYELGWIKEGVEVKVVTASLPGEEFGGTVSSINPVVDPKTRSITFRAEVDNPQLKLKPQMYVDLTIMSTYTNPEGEHMVLAVPKEAILDTGVRKVVWIDKGNEEYEGREIKIGPEATSIIDGATRKFYPVLRGLREGEQVVTKANFLIDSQSQISGVAASAYGGALGSEEKKTAPPVHQH